MREHVAKRPGNFIVDSSFPGGPRGLRGLGGEQEQLHLDEGKQEGWANAEAFKRKRLGMSLRLWLSCGGIYVAVTDHVFV